LSSKTEDYRLLIIEEIKRFIKSPENSMNKETGEPAWDLPLVGFSSGADPLYQFYKEDIGNFYLSPKELLAHNYPTVEFAPENITVVSWILPQTNATKVDQRKEIYFPSERWARSRIFGEEVNVKLRNHVSNVLKQVGIEALSPKFSPLNGRKLSDRYGIASTWSERHAAYTAGLGTFGLSDGLITPKGKAMRIGSVIAHTKIPPSNRPYTDHHAYCLFYRNGTCGECIKRCPIGAITEMGHDKILCQRYGDMCRQYLLRHYGLKGARGCGFCQTGVPCESRIPKGIEIS
jgi:ferredoxin